MTTIADSLDYPYNTPPNLATWAALGGGVFRGNYGGNGIGQTNAALGVTFLRWIGADVGDDYALTVRCSSFDVSASVGAAARLDADGNGYLALVRGGFDGMLYRSDAYALTPLASLGLTPVGQVFDVTLRVVGSLIAVALDGADVASVTDATYASGRPGLGAVGGNPDFGGNFADFAGESLAPPPVVLIPTEPAYRARRQTLTLRAAAVPARLAAGDDPARLRARRRPTTYRAASRPDTYEAA